MVKTKLVRSSDKIKTGTFKIDKDVGLAHVDSIKISSQKTMRRTSGKFYRINVTATHPVFDDVSFSFTYDPKKNESNDFSNRGGSTICMGATPRGEVKDIIVAALTHESYAWQLSRNCTTWIHAETNPNQGEYMLWHYKYYGTYSPRVKWKLPSECEKNELWKKNKCNLCAGRSCEYLMLKCTLCGRRTKNECPVCKEPTCNTHCKCKNNHYVLNEDGMFEGKCSSCRVKIPIGESKCPHCGRTKKSLY